jgi:hypothetical protein
MLHGWGSSTPIFAHSAGVSQHTAGLRLVQLGKRLKKQPTRSKTVRVAWMGELIGDRYRQNAGAVSRRNVAWLQRRPGYGCLYVPLSEACPLLCMAIWTSTALAVESMTTFGRVAESTAYTSNW